MSRNILQINVVFLYIQNCSQHKNEISDGEKIIIIIVFIAFEYINRPVSINKNENMKMQ